MNKKNTQVYGIIGLGRFGFALAQTLAQAKKEVMVIDCNEDKIREATAFTDHAFVINGLTKEALDEVGIRNCDTVIVCIGEKIDTSILTVLHLISFGVKRVIAKAISSDQGLILEKLGAEVVYPEREMAVRLANRLITSQVMEYISLSEEIDISELKLSQNTKGQTVLSLNLRTRFGLNIIAVKHDNLITTDISPELVLDENDIIVVIGMKESIHRFEEYIYEGNEK